MTRTHLRWGQMVLVAHANDADEAVTIWLLREEVWYALAGGARYLG